MPVTHDIDEAINWVTFSLQAHVTQLTGGKVCSQIVQCDKAVLSSTSTSKVSLCRMQIQAKAETCKHAHETVSRLSGFRRCDLVKYHQTQVPDQLPENCNGMKACIGMKMGSCRPALYSTQVKFACFGHRATCNMQATSDVRAVN